MTRKTRETEWGPLDDQRKLTDKRFFAGLNLNLPALKKVKAEWKSRNFEEAKAAIVRHFRKRRTPKITPYKTDLYYWGDLPDSSVEKRADLSLKKILVSPYGAGDGLNVKGRKSDPAGVNWKKAAGVAQRNSVMTVLASAWCRTKQQKYADGFREWVEGLTEGLPFVLDPQFHIDEFSKFGGKGHPQLSSCYKIFGWAQVLDCDLFRTAGVLPDEFWYFYIKMFWFYASQSTRFIGAPWRGDNHHLMERGVCCYFLGVQFPEFKRAKEMERYARRMIRRHFDHNALDDGSGSEHCASYQYRCFIRYAMPYSVAHANNRRLFDAKRTRLLLKWLLFQGYATAPDGALPDIGDGEGPPLLSIVAESGALYRSSYLKGIARALKIKGVPVNKAYAAEYRKVRPKLPDHTSTIFPKGGHLFLRDKWKTDANFLWMSLKNESLYDIHSHWDTLSFHIWARGRLILGDPMGRAYGRVKGSDRGYYFSMDAHNCMIIDNDILTSYKALEYSYGKQPPRIITAFTSFDDDFDYASFTHGGYRPLIHRRDVVFVRGRYFLITDGIGMDFRGFNVVFDSEGDIRPHFYKQRLHFEEGIGAKVLRKSNSIVTTMRTGPNLLIVPEPFEEIKVGIGIDTHIEDLKPRFKTCLQGYINRRTIGACFFSTVYRPFEGKRPNIKITVLTPWKSPYRRGRKHAVKIVDGATTDYWITQKDLIHPRPIKIRHGRTKIATDAASVFISIKRGQRPTGFRIGGKYVHLNGECIDLPRRKLIRHK